MNGSENGYAGALFFALVSLGAILKIDDAVGLFVGAACAFLAAISLRRALVQAAQATEEDHQRIEIQLQQLRSKVSETSSINAEAMTSVSDAAQLVQEDLQVIRVRLAELDNLTELTRHADTIRQTLAGLEEDSVALNTSLEKIFAAVSQEKNSDVSELFAQSFIALTDEFKHIHENAASNKNSLQSVLKLLQLIAQMLKNPVYVKEIEKINSSVETLAARADFDALKNSVAAADKNLSELVRINTNLSRNFSSTFDDLRLDVAKLSAKLEAINSPTDNHATLTAQDINLLKRIAAKINLK